MLGFKRCYGCHKLILPWQDSIRTEVVGVIHTGCAFAANVKWVTQQFSDAFFEKINREALVSLGVKEKEK